MKYIVIALALVAVCAAGCVNVDLGKASKDWANVAKGYSDAFKSGPVDQPGTSPQGEIPAQEPQQP